MSYTERPTTLFKLFFIFLRLGCTSFGGPIAHLSYFRQEFVNQRSWISDSEYTSLVALSQFLPGPASSQVGLGLGLRFAGYAGAAVAFIGFTLPSVLLLILFALNVDFITESVGSGWLQGLKLVAVAVVAQALLGMAKSFCTTRLGATIAIITCSLVLLIPSVYIQVICIVLAGVIAYAIAPDSTSSEPDSAQTTATGNMITWGCLGLFLVLLLLLPVMSQMMPYPVVELIEKFYRSGALVFGGGHVVLPLLQNEVVIAGMVGQERFLAGYGAAQAVPGPLFTFAAYLGAANQLAPNGWSGGFIAVAAIFLPAWLLLLGALPIWQQLQHNQHMKKALIGINASVVGLLLAAFYDPIWTSSVNSAPAFILAAGALLALLKWQAPPTLIVIVLPIVASLVL
ncbi:MAG: chromate efflux transporter [Aestuariibacter sp.]